LIAVTLLATLALVPADSLPGIALERRTAATLDARVGDTLELALEPGAAVRRVTVRAIYEPATDPSTVTRRDLAVRFHLPDLGALLGAPDRVDRFGVALQPGADPIATAAELNQVAFGFRAAPSALIASESSQTFRVVSRFHAAIAVISVIASAIFLLCIMLLKVEERRRDAAVMRFCGVRRRTIFGALLLEAVLVASLGSSIGVVLAVAAGAVTNGYYQHFFATRLIFSQITFGIIRFSVLLSLGLGLGAGSLAAWRLVRTNPMILWGRG
jgi:putative ABC transport system permease protein